MSKSAHISVGCGVHDNVADGGCLPGTRQRRSMSEGRVQDSSYASASTMSAGSPVPPEEHYGPGSDDTASEYSWTALNRGRRKDEDSSSEGHSSVAGHLSSFEVWL
ncbi:hypothetical protein V5799_024379 [Amblyomma americanum]|uniref:Uncharacterized protein n=1 Tax=Amblyomma americanum TaxID=6943 RepID=A0AAQ4ECK6_AMBAM